MRKIDKIIIHATDTRPKTNVTIAMIDKWHRERGFDECGYHFLIDRSGMPRIGRDLNKIGAHTEGHNTGSIGIAIAGGYRGRFNFTRDQIEALAWQVILLKKTYGDHITVHGHNEFSRKSCPCFDVKEFFSL